MLESIKRIIWPRRHPDNLIIDLLPKSETPQIDSLAHPEIHEDTHPEKTIIKCPKCSTSYITKIKLLTDYGGAVDCSLCKWEWVENVDNRAA